MHRAPMGRVTERGHLDALRAEVSFQRSLVESLQRTSMLQALAGLHDYVCMARGHGDFSSSSSS